MKYQKSCERTLSKITHFFENIEEIVKQRGIAQAEFDKIQRLATTEGNYLIATHDVLFGRKGRFKVLLSVQLIDFETIELWITLDDFSSHFIFKVNQELNDVSDATDFLWFTHKVFWYGFNEKSRLRANIEINRKLKVFLSKN